MAIAYLGRVGFVNKGVYNVITTYKLNDVVTYANSTYSCLVAGTASLPGINTDWTIWIDSTKYVSKDSTTGAAKIPAGTDAERPLVGALVNGSTRYNTDSKRMEVYDTVYGWTSAGGGQLLGTAATKAIQFMAQTTDEDLVIPDGSNGFAIDSLEILEGGSLTIPNGSVFKIL